MKLARLVATALTVAVLGAWAVWAVACDQDKVQTSAASKAAMSGSCPHHNATTAMASKDACTAHSTTAVAASSNSCSGHGASAAVAAGAGACASKASKVSAGMCAGKATAAGSDHCSGAKNTMAMSGDSHCRGMGMAAAAGVSDHGDCDACENMAAADAELRSAGAHTQIVPLKNGVMFVYTADSPGQVSAVQAAMARRGDRLAQLVAAGDKVHLCSECKSMRGAMASGKLTREVVNIEGGSLTLVTSSDPSVVAKIHAMMDAKTASRMKS